MVRVARGSALLVLAAGVPALGEPRSFDPVNPPQGVFMDDWYAATIGGARCGHMRSMTRRDGDTIISRAEFSISMRREQAAVTIEMTQSYRETIDGKALSFEHSMNMAGQPIVQRGVISGRTVKMTSEQFGTKQTKTIRLDRDVQYTWGQWLAQHKHGLKPGTKFSIASYEPTLKADEPVELDIEVIGTENVKVGDRSVSATRVRTTTKLSVPIPSDSWVDSMGVPLVVTMRVGFLDVRLERTDRRSIETGKPDELPELFLSTFIRVKEPVDRMAKGLVLRLSVDEDNMPELPTTGMQTPQRINDRTVELTIRRIDWESVRREAATNVDIPPDVRARYLRGSTYLDTSDKRIRELALQGRAHARDRARLAHTLCRFVEGYVEDKNLGVGFATASEVAKSREGDCTEHSVLLAALARANGLPSRGVAGLVMITGPSAADAQFGYHMWTQVYVAGRWVDIDAAMRQPECDPTHIALGILALDDDGVIEGATSMMPLMGRLKISVIRTIK